MASPNGATLSKAALDRALIAPHQQEVLVGGDVRQPFSDRVILAKDVVDIVEEEHSNGLDPVVVVRELAST